MMQRAVVHDVGGAAIAKGQPFPVANGVFMSANTGMAAFSISETGDLLYATGPEERGTRIPVWVDKKGFLRVTHQSYKPGDENEYMNNIRMLLREK